MLSQKTWPNFKRGNNRDGTRAIIEDLGVAGDVQYGNTKIFIRKPQTLFILESKRTDRIPAICITLQKVTYNRLIFFNCAMKGHGWWCLLPRCHLTKAYNNDGDDNDLRRRR